MYNPNAEICESADDGDYGFVFSNQRVEEIFQWQPKILFTDRVATILDNIKKSIRAI
jgi:hypothetical protein